MAPKVAPKARGGKRATSIETDLGELAETASPAAKKSKTDPLIDAVTESFTNMELSANCQKMFAALAPGCLGTPIEDRQELQVMAVQMISDVIDAHRRSLQQAIAAEETKLLELEAARKASEAKVEQTDATAAECMAVSEAAKKSLADASRDVFQAQQGLTDAEEALNKDQLAVDQADDDRRAVESALKENFAILKAGDWEAGQAKYHIDIVAPLVTRIRLDESLATALPSSLTKKPAERGPFDRTVVEQLELGLQAKITEFTKFFDETGPRVVALKAAVERTQRLYDASKERQKEAASELAIAEAAQREVTATLENEKAVVEAFGPQHEKASQAALDKAATLRNFESSVVACFETLRNRTTAVDSCAMVSNASKVIDQSPQVESPLALAVGGW